MLLRNLAFLTLGFVLLVVQAAVASHVPLHPFTPNLLLPIVLYLGMQHEAQMLRGAMISFLLGYLVDEFCGSPIGLQTFVLVATFMVAWGAGIRLWMRGLVFQLGLVFAVAMVAGGTILALRAIFSPPEAFPLSMPAESLAGEAVGLLVADAEAHPPLVGNVLGIALTLVASSLATALSAPPVFAMARRIDALRTRRRDAEGSPAP